METLLRFRGNRLSFYSDLNIGALFNENYISDIYVDTSILSTLPILYITNWVTFDNDLVVFILLYCFSIFNVVLLYKILKAVSDNITLIFTTLTILIFVDISPIEMVQTSPVAFSLKPTVLSHSLLFLILYLVVINKSTLALIFASLSLIINVKLGWAPFIFVFIYQILCGYSERNFHKITVSIIIFIMIATFVLVFNNKYEYILDVVLERNGNEDLLSLHPLAHSFGLFSLFFALVYFSFKNDVNKSFLFSYFIIIFIFFALYIYQLLFFNDFPNVKVSLISIVRNLNLLILLSVIIYLKTRQVDNVDIVDIIFIISLVLIVRIPILTLFLPGLIFFGKQNYKVMSTHCNNIIYKGFCWFIVCILVFKSVIDFTDYFDKLEAIWNDSYNNSIPSKVEAEVLSIVPSGHMLLHLKESEASYRASINGKMKGLPKLHGFVPVTLTNTQLKFSKYIGDFAHFYGNKSLFEEHLNRLSKVNHIACVANFGVAFCAENNKAGELFIDDNLSLLIEIKKSVENVSENLLELGFHCNEITPIQSVCVPD